MPIQLDLTQDQTLLHETTVRFIADRLPREATRAWHEGADGFDVGWLAETAELGWFSMLVPEADGGGSVSDNPLADAALIAEELGRNVQPGPFVSMNVALASIARNGTPDLKAPLLADAVAGQVVVTWAPADIAGNFDLGVGVMAAADGDGYVITGRRGRVADAAQADHILVSATLDGEPVQVLVPTAAPGVEVFPLATLDLARRLADVHLDSVRVPASALVTGGAQELWRAHRQAVALNVVETVGAMDELFAMTVEYSKDRIAFGRPIGSFQALKHEMADQALSLEVAKAAATAAVDAVGADAADAPGVTAMAAAAVGDAGNDLAQQCLQILGGIGYTWEHDLHLFMRRIQSNSALFGTPTWHREQLCRFDGLDAEARA